VPRADRFGSAQVPRARVASAADSVVCLELMTAVVIRNAGRAGLVWPLVHMHLRRVMEPRGGSGGDGYLLEVRARAVLYPVGLAGAAL
jgi:hypothetical protein